MQMWKLWQLQITTNCVAAAYIRRLNQNKRTARLHKVKNREVREVAMADDMTVEPGAVIAPDATPADAVVSASVVTVMPLVLPVTAPIFNPLRVMRKAVVAAMPATAVVMTMELPEMTDVAVIVATDVLPAALFAGLGAVAKNPAG
jgi:hypothetical protein